MIRNKGSTVIFAVVALLLGALPLLLGALDVPLVTGQEPLPAAEPQGETAVTAAIQEIALQVGWNMISSYIDPTDPLMDNMLAGIAAELILVKDGYGNVYWPPYNIDQLGQWHSNQGYLIYMSGPATLTINGAYIDAANTPQDLNAGWNMIAYHRDTGLPVEEALGSLSDQLVLVKDNAGQIYWPDFDINTLETLSHGQGYQIYLSEAATLQYPSGPTSVCGNITTDTTWTAAQSPYLVTCNMNVRDGATLTLEAGTQVKVGYRWDILVTNGSLLVQGTADNQVIVTSSYDDEIGGDTNGDGSASQPSGVNNWGTIGVYQGSTAELDHAWLRYGGNDYYGGAGILEVESGSQVTLRDSKIWASYEHGARLVSRSSALESSLTVLNSELRFNRYGISVESFVVGGRTNLTVQQSTIRGNSGHGISNEESTYSGSQIFTLEDSEFINNGFDAVNLALPRVQSIRGNTGSGNRTNGIFISGYLNTALLQANPDFPYVFSNSGVSSGQTVTLDAGTVVKISPQRHIAVNGRLIAQGSAEAPVFITSLPDDSVGGDTNNDGPSVPVFTQNFEYISANSGGSVELHHTTLRHGGYFTGDNHTLIIYGNGTAELYNSAIYGSSNSGIYLKSATAGQVARLTVIDSEIRQNGDHGIEVAGANGSYQVAVQNSVIRGNGQYGILNGDAVGSVDARRNYWGSADGPAPYGSGDEINTYQQYDPDLETNVTRPKVAYQPWLDETGQEMDASPQEAHGAPSSANTAWATDPVNVVFGNYIYQKTDLAFPGRGVGFAFQRTYNSTNVAVGALGRGWMHNYEISAMVTADNNVIVQREDGRKDLYVADGAGNYLAPHGVHDKLIWRVDHFELLLRDQVLLIFKPNGTLLSITNPRGGSATLSYNAGKVSTVTLEDGRVVTFTYNGDRLQSIGDPAGRTVIFAYTNDLLTSVTDVRQFVTTMAYTGGGLLQSLTDANGHTFVQNTYDAEGRVVEQLDGQNNLSTLAYDPIARRTVVTDNLDRNTTYLYDGNYRIISEENDLGDTKTYSYDLYNNRTAVQDHRGFTTEFTYDGSGNVLTIKDPLNFTTSFTYDAYNNLRTETDPLDNTTTYGYDAKHNLTTVTDALNNVSSFTYDGLGQMETSTDAKNHVTTYGYDGYGHKSSVTDPLGHVSSAVFDIIGRMLSASDANGHTSSHTYDPANHLLTSTDPLGNVTTVTYDDVGNRDSITDPKGGVTSFTYDAKDQLATTTDPLGNITIYDYDAVGNQTGITDPLGHTSSFTYDQLNRRKTVVDTLGHTTTYGYDPSGNRTSVTDAEGNTTTYSYDARNRLETVTDAEGGVVSYSYDANGNRDGMTDANGHSTSYSYDELRRLESSTNPLSHTVSYGYDNVGNKTSQTKADGEVISYTYDTLNRLTDISYTGGSIEYDYDNVGNRSVMTDTVGITTYTYDRLDRISAVASPTGTVSYTYDANSNRATMTLPGSQTVTYDHTANNQLYTVTDWASRTTTYTYDDSGRQTGIAYPNGVDATYTYDDANRLTSLVHEHATNGVIASFSYTLDDVGNRLSMTDWEGVTAYDYDDLYRLTEVTYPDGEGVTYTYDPMGNRQTTDSTVHGLTSYTYDDADRMLTAGTTSFGWDENGNMTGKGTGTYTWDALDRLEQVVDGGTTVSFAYDGDGTRLGKTVNGVTTEYLQDTAAPLPQVASETTMLQTQHFVYGNDLITLEDPLGTPNFYHPDGLGSTRALSDAAGMQTDLYTYDSFGTERSHTGAAGQDFTYTGEKMDPATGLMFLRARYYDPQTGRFLSSDTYPSLATDSQTINRYVYVENNPLVLVDPTGHAFWVSETNPNDPRNRFWSWAANQSDQHDTEIKLAADVIGIVPIAGSIWKHNILYATDKEETREFMLNQSVNAVALGAGGLASSLKAGQAASFLITYGGETIKNNLLYAGGLQTRSQYILNSALGIAGSMPPEGAVSLLFDTQKNLLDLALEKMNQFSMGRPPGITK